MRFSIFASAASETQAMGSLFYTCLVGFAVLAASVSGFVGDCTYDSDKCSCKYGNENEGTCWDAIAGAPGRCRSRSCKAGWTCACGGRTHLCNKVMQTAHVVVAADKGAAEAPCEMSSTPGIGGRDLSLGTVDMRISPKGAQANDCLQVAFWHNGELQEVFGPVPGVDGSTVGAELEPRQTHSLLELRDGDVVAWRFKASSYYCQMTWMDVIVNGTSLNFSSPQLDIRYARMYTPNWFSSEFTPALGAGETEADLKAFIPARTQMFSGMNILPNVDYWQTPDQSSADHKTSNWYWRMTIDLSVTG